METEINLEKIRNCKVFLGCPMYGGGCEGFFAKSLFDLAVFFTKYSLSLKPFFLFNESLITRARNYIADEFMRSDCTHLLFIDSDIKFSAEDVIIMMHYAVTQNLDVVCGPYPKKNVSWEKIKKAVDSGKGDSNPNDLEKYMGDFVFNVTKNGSYNLLEPIEVNESGTGFMLIKKEVFQDFDAHYPEMKYFPDHKRNKEFSGDREITAYFMDPIINKRHYSEDYMFCKYIRDIGRKVWLLPWLKLDHIGKFVFTGDLISVVTSGSSATIDEKDIEKVKR